MSHVREKGGGEVEVEDRRGHEIPWLSAEGDLFCGCPESELQHRSQYDISTHCAGQASRPLPHELFEQGGCWYILAAHRRSRDWQSMN